MRGLTKHVLCAIINLAFAGVAHLVERDLAKVEVASSSLVARSKNKTPSLRMGFCFWKAAGRFELAASTCAKRVKFRGEAGFLRMAMPFAGCREASSSLVARSKNTTLSGGVFLCAPRRSPSCQPAAGGYRSRQPGHFLESASLHPPQAALRRFPRRPLQKEYPIRQDGVFFLEMCRSAGEIAASTCTKRVKSGGETGHRRSQRERNAAAVNVRC